MISVKKDERNNKPTECSLRCVNSLDDSERKMITITVDRQTDRWNPN